MTKTSSSQWRQIYYVESILGMWEELLFVTVIVGCYRYIRGSTKVIKKGLDLSGGKNKPGWAVAKADGQLLHRIYIDMWHTRALCPLPHHQSGNYRQHPLHP